MTTSTSKLITEIREAEIDAKPFKLATHYNPYVKWGVEVIYLLDDGTELMTIKGFNLKRDAVAFIATLPAPPTHKLEANFHDGDYVGTTESFGFGVRNG